MKLSDPTVAGTGRRAFLGAAATIGAGSLAGCLGRIGAARSGSALVPVGEPVDTGDLVLAVESIDLVDEIEVHTTFSSEVRREPDSVFALPWIRVEHVGDEPRMFFNALHDVSVRYADEEPEYEGGRQRAITVHGETAPSYYTAYREIDRPVAPGTVVEGYGPVYRLPADVDPTQLTVQITVDDRDYTWVLELPADA